MDLFEPRNYYGLFDVESIPGFHGVQLWCPVFGLKIELSKLAHSEWASSAILSYQPLPILFHTLQPLAL